MLNFTSFRKGGWKISKDALVVAKGPKTRTSYTLKTLIGKLDLVVVTKEGNSADLWHKCLGHISEKGLKILVGKNLLLGLKSYNLDLCEHCIYGRQRMVSFLRGGHDRKKNVLELVHSDVFGPVNIKSLGGASYFVTFIDDASRKVWAYPMKNKSEVFGIFQKFHVAIERETNKLLKCLKTDNGGEYCSNAFKEYCNRFGMKHKKTVLGTPQHNVVAERMNQIIMEKVRSMLSNFSLEKNFWVETVRTACYLINRSPTTALDGDILEDVWTGKNLNYSHLKFFGCEAFVHIPKENRTKLDDKSMKLIFLGYVDEDFGYCLWDLVKHKIIRRRDVIFNESEMFKRIVGELKVKKVIDRFEEQQENIPPIQENEQQIQEHEEQQEEGILQKPLQEIQPDNAPQQLVRRSSRPHKPSQKYPLQTIFC